MRRRLLLLLLLVLAAPARAEEPGWLDWANRGIFAFNAGLAERLSGAGEELPPLPEEVRSGLRNLGTTLVGDPLNALAHGIAGRGDDAWTALRRVGINLTRGWLGTVDRATEEGVVATPIDFGLALCVRGVPPGPFIVLPFAGPRTLRDGLADWVMAHVLLYGAIIGVLQVPPSIEGFLLFELVEEVATLTLAGEIGEVPPEALRGEFAGARALYLAARERRCAELSGGG